MFTLQMPAIMLPKCFSSFKAVILGRLKNDLIVQSVQFVFILGDENKTLICSINHLHSSCHRKFISIIVNLWRIKKL